MNVEAYLKKRKAWQAQAPVYRSICETCRQPDFSCYCMWLQPFDPGIDFIILIHPIEFRRRIATGRLAHLNLKHSRLIRGVDFSENVQINELLRDSSRQAVMLYPGRQSLNLSEIPEQNRASWVHPDKKLTIFVMDGSWATVSKMIRLSPNLAGLPRICFTPRSPSNFRIRRQPHAGCYSTIESIHETIELLLPCLNLNLNAREHDYLLEVFDRMVNRQIELAHVLPSMSLTKHRRFSRDRS